MRRDPVGLFQITPHSDTLYACYSALRGWFQLVRWHRESWWDLRRSWGPLASVGAVGAVGVVAAPIGPRPAALIGEKTQSVSVSDSGT